MAEVLLINANMIFPGESKISGRPVQIRDIEKVVNLGLLSIASYLDAEGISVKIIDLVGHKDDTDLLREALESENPRFAGISCISCFTYPKLMEYAELIKKWNKDIFVMAGGQHISGIPHIAIQEARYVDCVVKGEGEYICREIIERVKAGKSLSDVPSIAYREAGQVTDSTGSCGEKVDLEKLPFLKYDLYPNFKTYSPHVEISRWCVFSCNFCTSGGMSRGMSYKSITRFLDEVVYIQSVYGDAEDLKFFFACSTFGLKRNRIEELIRQIKARGIKISWRTETRSDAPVVEYLEELSQVGLSVLDLGLESGSPKMLTLMNKCRDTEDYLAKARVFIRRTAGLSMLLKINLVFYAGETPDTVRETINFMIEHADHIDSISAGPVVVYAGTPLVNKFPEYALEYGTSLVTNEFWHKVHAYPVNPSASLSFDQLNSLALIMSKMFCSEKEYFEVKKHGQLPHDMELEDFRQIVAKQEGYQLPFDFEPKGRTGESSDLTPAELFDSAELFN